MISTQSLLKSKNGRQLPAKIRNHSALKSISNIEKVFPYIGLKNSSTVLKSKIEEFDGCKICFSSDKNSGAWDIATMSMRGIHSCMKWSSSQSKHLIGSIIDPFTAVIYITDGKKLKYGSKFLRRSVVRYMIYEKNGGFCKPFIYIERVYRHNNIRSPVEGQGYANKDANEQVVLNIFSEYIRSKLKDTNIPVWSNYSIPTEHSYFMISSPSYRLIEPEEISYSDRKFGLCELLYSTSKVVLPAKFLVSYK
jgi:hypothetical protein